MRINITSIDVPLEDFKKDLDKADNLKDVYLLCHQCGRPVYVIRDVDDKMLIHWHPRKSDDDISIKYRINDNIFEQIYKGKIQKFEPLNYLREDFLSNHLLGETPFDVEYLVWSKTINTRGVKMNNTDGILKRDWSNDFNEKMKNRMVNSHYKYGFVSQTYPEIGDAIASLKERVELYEKTGNTEWLVDVANFAMIEYMFPKHANAHFRATGSDESPGVVGGSYNEMLDEVR